MKILSLLVLFVSLFAGEAYSADERCLVFVNETQKKDFPDAQDDLFRLLKYYKLTPRYTSYSLKYSPGQLYLEITKNLIKGSIFPPCEVTVKLYRSEKEILNPLKDELVFQNKGRREKPRDSTGEGIRCLYALKDALVGINICSKLPSVAPATKESENQF